MAAAAWVQLDCTSLTSSKGNHVGAASVGWVPKKMWRCHAPIWLCGPLVAGRPHQASHSLYLPLPPKDTTNTARTMPRHGALLARMCSHNTTAKIGETAIPTADCAKWPSHWQGWAAAQPRRSRPTLLEWNTSSAHKLPSPKQSAIIPLCTMRCGNDGIERRDACP